MSFIYVIETLGRSVTMHALDSDKRNLW